MKKANAFSKYILAIIVLLIVLVTVDLLLSIGREAPVVPPITPAVTSSSPALPAEEAPVAPVTPPSVSAPSSVPVVSAPPAPATSAAPVLTSSSYPLTPPDAVMPLHSTGSAELETFDMAITKSGYDPSVIVIPEGNGVALDVKALDGAYDIFFPSLSFGSSQIPKGQTSFLSFIPPKAGEYVFECRTYCPYGTRIMGKVIVLPQ